MIKVGFMVLLAVGDITGITAIGFIPKGALDDDTCAQHASVRNEQSVYIHVRTGIRYSLGRS